MKLALNGEIYEIGGESPSYTAGDGLSIESGAISLQNPMHGIYTQAEFNALSEEQKKSGTYIVDDGNNGGGSSSSSDIYSTEEQRVGTWIDGKPLYKRTWGGHTASEAKTWTETGIVIENLDTLVDYEALMVANMSNTLVKIPYFETANSYANISYWTGAESHNGFCTYCYRASGSYFYNAPFYLTAWYTKTTDASPSETSSASLSTNVLTDVVDSITPSIMSTTMGISDAEEVSE